MNILAVETSTMLGGVAIANDTLGIITELRINVRATHSERLITGIDFALKQAGITISDIDAFGVSIGPGSFTGLRIGLSTIKGFSYSTGKPVVSVPTLEAFAWNFPYSKYPVCIMLDARKKEVYAAVFRWRDDNFERIVSEVSIRPVDLLKSLEGPVIFAGEGALLYREAIIDISGSNAILAPPQCMVPSPANVAYLGLRKATAEYFSEPVSLAPSYLRKSEAEIKFKG